MTKREEITEARINRRILRAILVSTLVLFLYGLLRVIPLRFRLAWARRVLGE
ncbi:hypothetical protein LCGC14_1405630 [marine sediment metagenome]|uniref:Uncharacterized protein n=1 Tax=marine sediment metagenome TaxID=412755 RepID=A0A0F9MXC3_9ZZZZ